MDLCPGLPRWASTRKVKPIWILLKQETVSGSGISWAICKSAPRSRQITTQAPKFFAGQMPFLVLQHQSTEGKDSEKKLTQRECIWTLSVADSWFQSIMCINSPQTSPHAHVSSCVPHRAGLFWVLKQNVSFIVNIPFYPKIPVWNCLLIELHDHIIISIRNLTVWSDSRINLKLSSCGKPCDIFLCHHVVWTRWNTHTHTHPFNGPFLDYPGEPVPER